ncbi:MAG: hypothetical protein HY360_08125 [Verrucomicrobia bacterium]|nr:hypothetical protein [Verrucomicrobiota bacterium]
MEYSLAYEMNHLLEAEGKGFSLSAVLWNVFPDLLMRDASRTPTIGFEVKALHTAAEEKSANLSTPLHMINKGGDFLVIVIWGWQREVVGSVSITYPHIHLVEVFDAYVLAQTRDYSWLFTQGNRIKGIDISTPIITPEDKPKGDRFKAEEGNMGKLMRIGLDPNLPAETPNLEALKAEAATYDAFKQRVLAFGLTETFREICFLQEAENVKMQTVQAYPEDLQMLGQARLKGGNEFCLLAGRNLSQWQKEEEMKSIHTQGSVSLWLSSKLNWHVLQKGEHGWKVVGSGEKPDSAYDKIGELLASK